MHFIFVLVCQPDKKRMSLRNCVKDNIKKRSVKNIENRKKYVYDILSLLSPLLAGKSSEIDDELFVKKVKEEDDTLNNNEIEENVSKFLNKRRNREESAYERYPYKYNNDKQERLTTHEPDEKDNQSKHFLMSLLEDFDAIPKTYKVDAKFEILSVLRKYNKREETTTTSVPAVLIPEYKRTGIESDSSVLSDLFIE